MCYLCQCPQENERKVCIPKAFVSLHLEWQTYSSWTFVLTTASHKDVKRKKHFLNLYPLLSSSINHVTGLSGGHKSNHQVMNTAELCVLC